MVWETTSFELATIRERLSRDGYVYINEVRDGFDYPTALGQIGPLLPQYAGELVRDIKPDPGVRDDEISAYNTSELAPHTEWYEFSSLPPAI